MFKFLHAADLHLDSPLRGLQRYEGAPVDEIRGAPRRALENLVELAVAEQVAFVVIAGDVYDGDWPDYNTGLFFVKQMQKLRNAEIRVFLIKGNHDAENRMTSSLMLPKGVHQFAADQAKTVTLPELNIALHGQSFATQAVTENLALDYPAAKPGMLNLGILHTCATSSEHERYAPCSIEDLRLKGYDYWALGHVHQRQTLWEADPWIGFPGNPQGRHIRETGPKGCLLVTVDEQQRFTPEFRELDVLRWELATIDVTDMESEIEVYDAISDKLRFLLSQTGGRLLATRVELQGVTPLHRELLGQRQTYMQEVRNRALQVGNGEIWVEQLKVHTTDVAERPEQTEVPEAALEEVQRLFADARQQGTDWEGCSDDWSKLAGKLPEELRQQVFPVKDPEWLQERLAEAEALLMSQLLRQEET